METKIVLLGYIHSETNGHISARVQSVTTDGPQTWKGPVRTYGIDAHAFRVKFNGDLDHFEKWIANEHKQYIGANAELTQALEKRKGAVIG